MSEYEQSEMEKMIRSSVRELIESYEDAYWEEVRESRRYPDEVWNDLAENGWIGVAIPEEYGGEGLGIRELATVIEEVSAAGGWTLGLKFVLSPVFGGETLTAHGSQEQRERWLPAIAKGEAKWALGVTEPNSGLNTKSIETTAERDGDEYVINGQKTWCSGVDEASRITLLTRTLSPEEADRSSHGMSVFLVDPDQAGVEYDEITLDNYFPDRTYNVYLDDVRVHEDDMIGEEHKGLYQVFDVLNSERITTAACSVGTGQYALEKAADYASEREVFDAPIGSHQGVAHPLAKAYTYLEAGRLLRDKAAWLYDEGEPAGTESNMANYICCRAGWEACEAAHVAFGGTSITPDTGISAMTSYLRHLRIAPVSEEMILNFVAEQELGLPKSY